MTMMKTVRIDRYGDSSVLVPGESPLPSPGHGEIVVKIAAVGVNFAEVLQRQDRYPVRVPLPAVLGTEVAGTVAAIGPGVSGRVVGERVAAALFAQGRHDGGYAEYVAIGADHVAPVPDAVSFPIAVALMVQGLSALHLVRRVDPRGKSVVVTAAAGGVGSLLVQLARRAGASRVVAACSAAKHDFVRGLGADMAVDYRHPDWAIALKAGLEDGPDIVYDSVGGEVTRSLSRILAPRGTMVVYGALNALDFRLEVPDLLRMVFNNQSLTGFALVPLLNAGLLRDGLNELFGLYLDGALTVTVGDIFPLADAARAHHALESRASIGKLVLVP